MRKLKVLVILAIVATININAQNSGDLLKTQITLERNEATVQAFLDEISNKYSIVFSYEPSEIELNKIVKLPAVSMVLVDILTEIFKNTSITFVVHSNVIVLRKIKTEKPKKKITISGIIKDLNSAESLVGSTIFAIEAKAGEIANQYGFYSLTLPEGRNRIQFSCIGYETMIIDTLIKSNLRYDVELNPANIQLNEVIVTEKVNKLYDFKQGFNRIEMKSVKSLPSLFGETDVIKNVLLLPGVNTTSELGGNFQVRGGSWDQNLMLLDEAIVYNSNHLFGLYSTYNPDMIKDIKFYKSSISASYGGRVSSVMDVTQKDGNMKSYHIDGGLGIISGRIAVEGPIEKDKSSFIIAARRSIFEPYMKYVDNENAKDLRPYFYDINSKFNYIFNQNNRLYLSCYYGADQMSVIDEQNQQYGNITGTLRFNHIFNDRLFSNTSLIFSSYKMAVDNKSDDTLKWAANMGLEHYEFKNDFVYSLLRHNFKFGLQSIFYTFHPGERIPDAINKYTTRIKIDDEYSLESALFLEDNIKVFNNLEVKAGLRLSNYNCFGSADIYVYRDGEPRSNDYITDTLRYKNGEIIKSYNYLEPRLSLKYTISEFQSVSASYNNMKQYVQLVTRTFSPQPYDMWKPSDNYIKPLSVDQLSLGWFVQLKDRGLDFSIESYYKILDNVVDVKAGTETFFNTNINSAIVQGTGKSYGVEFSANRNKGKLTGALSYTWSRSLRKVDSKYLEEKINLGKEYPTDYDIPHKISISGEYELSKRLSFTANFIYQTGRPLSYPSGQFYYMNSLMSYYSGKNQQRYSAFHRLDVGLILRNKPRFNQLWHSYWVLSIYNIYNRENEYFSGIRYKENGRNTELVSLWIFNVVPSLTYNFKF
jgi:hypothetical protein